VEGGRVGLVPVPPLGTERERLARTHVIRPTPWTRPGRAGKRDIHPGAAMLAIVT